MAEGYVNENGRIRWAEPPELEDPPLPPPANADDDRDEEEGDDDDDEEEGDEFARAASADHGLRWRGCPLDCRTGRESQERRNLTKWYSRRSVRSAGRAGGRPDDGDRACPLTG